LDFFPDTLSCEFLHGGYKLFWSYFGYKFEKKAKNLGKFEFFSKPQNWGKKKKKKQSLLLLSTIFNYIMPFSAPEFGLKNIPVTFSLQKYFFLKF
jgi:hypothetical protein